MEFHEVVYIFPDMEPDEYIKLVADIRQNGLREPIWTYQDKIIDGRHRYNACVETHTLPRYQEWDGVGSLTMFVVSLNLHRRHMNSGQKSFVALNIESQLAIEAKENMSKGGGDKKSGLQIIVNPIIEPLHAAEQAAKIVGTNHSYVTDAKKIVATAPELQPLVMNNVITLPEAKRLASHDAPYRAAIVQQIVNGETKNVKSAQLSIAKQSIESQAQMQVVKPSIQLASYETWLEQQPLCDLLITDPPYSTDVDDIESFAQAWLPKALAKVKSTGRAYVCIGSYPKELKAYLSVAASLEVRQVLVWSYKNTMGPSPLFDYKNNWQAILYFYGEDAPSLDCPLMNEQFSVQEINAPDGRMGDRYHMWQKPLELAERLIRHSTKKGDIVLDCFAGTGTFLLAANSLGRVAYGCDISSEMLAIAEKRGCDVR